MPNATEEQPSTSKESIREIQNDEIPSYTSESATRNVFIDSGEDTNIQTG